MKKLLAIALGIVSVMASVASIGAACGDKFLAPGRGPQLNKVYSALQPGRILIYRNSASEVAMMVMDRELEESLERVGHQVDVVENPGELQDALDSGNYDVVLAAVSDVAKMLKSDGPASGSPVVLPVVYEASWMEVNELRKAYQFVLNAPSRISHVLSVIEEAITQRHAAG